jgi:hypothetical protein
MGGSGDFRGVAAVGFVGSIKDKMLPIKVSPLISHQMFRFSNSSSATKRGPCIIRSANCI